MTKRPPKPTKSNTKPQEVGGMTGCLEICFFLGGEWGEVVGVKRIGNSEGVIGCYKFI